MFLSGFSAVEACSKGVFSSSCRYGKTPWFSRYVICIVADLDWAVSSLGGFNMQFLRSCAS